MQKKVIKMDLTTDDYRRFVKEIDGLENQIKKYEGEYKSLASQIVDLRNKITKAIIESNGVKSQAEKLFVKEFNTLKTLGLEDSGKRLRKEMEAVQAADKVLSDKADRIIAQISKVRG